MRKINGHDVFLALRVVKCLGIQDEMKQLMNTVRENKKAKAEEIGLELIFNVLGNCGDQASEDAILLFLSGPLEKTQDELKEMDAIELVENIKEMISSSDKDAWLSFFKSLGSLLNFK